MERLGTFGRERKMNLLEIVEDPLFKEIPGTAFKLYVYFLTAERKGVWFRIPVKQISEDTGIGERSIYRNLNLLKQAEIIEIVKHNRGINEYRVNE